MAALDNIASELLKSANEADSIFKKTRDQAQRDKAVRLRRIVENLRNITLGASDLNGLSDVAISSPTNAQVLSYNSTTLKWQNTTISTATPTLAQVTTAGNTTTNAITVGGLTSNGIINAGSNLIGRNDWNQGIVNFGSTGEVRFVNGTGGGHFFTWYQNGGTANERMRLSTSNNLLIGTTTDSGYKLDVVGTGRFSSTLTIATAATDASPSNSILITTANSGNGGRISWGDSNTSILRYSNSLYFREYTGNFRFESTGSGAALVYISSVSTSVLSGKFITSGSTTAASALAQGVYFNNTLVAAANNDVLVGLDINPTFTNGAFTGVSNLALRVAYVAGRYISFRAAPGYADFGQIVFSNVTGAEIISSGSIGLGPSDTNKTLILGNGITSKITTPGSTKYDGYGNQTPATLGVTTNRPFLFTSTIPDGGIDGFIFENTSSGSRNLFKVIQNNTTLFTLNPNGNVLIGTTTDAGYKLDVNGTTRLNGAIAATDTITSTASGFALYKVGGNGVRMGNLTFDAGGLATTQGGSAGSLLWSSTNFSWTLNKYLTIQGSLVVNSSLTASAALAQGVYFNNTLVAAANNDVLVGLDINPTFTNGAFTGVTNYSLRALGSLGSDGTDVYSGYVARIQNTKDYDTTNGVLLLVNQNGGNGGHFIKAVNAQAGQVRFLVDGNGNLGSIGNGSFAGDVKATKIRWNTDSDGWIGDGGLDGTFMVVTDGTERYRVTPNGNLLINTTTDAGYKLDVNGTGRFQDYLVFSAGKGIYTSTGTGNTALLSSTNYFTHTRLASSGTMGFQIGYVGSVNSFWRWNDGTGDVEFGNAAGYGMHLYTNNLSRMFINSAGNVGIGTSTPTDKFHIVDNTNGNKFGRISAGGTDASAAWVAQNDQVDNIVYRVFGSAVTGSQMGQALARSASLIANLGGTGKFLIGSYSGTDLIFGTSDQARMRLVDATGNFLIGTMTDTGNKLTVSGNIDAQGYKVNNVLGYTGILNIPTNPPGQQNIDIQGGIVINIF